MNQTPISSLKTCPTNSSAGFTLMELLIVVVILGVLSAIAIPNFINQIGKAREAEVKGIVGSIGRAQQAYHFEKGTFATSIKLLNDGRSSASFNSNYADFPDPVEATGTRAKHTAIAINPDDRIRNYSVGIYFSSGAFGQMFCESADVGENALAGDSPDGDCDEGNRIK
jgi:type IV pilus assembly protein PilA